MRGQSGAGADALLAGDPGYLTGDRIQNDDVRRGSSARINNLTSHRIQDDHVRRRLSARFDHLAG
jgi:hypothetical protein